MMTSMGSVNLGLDPHQVAQAAQFKANEKTAEDDLKTEEQPQTESVSSQTVNVMKSASDIRMMQIRQAADAGILRPVWLEMLEMDPDMPRMSDMIRRSVEKGEVDAGLSDAAERALKSVGADEANAVGDKAEYAVKSGERASDGAERAVKSVHASDGAERAVKPEMPTAETEHTVKSESVSSEFRSVANLSE